MKSLTQYMLKKMIRYHPVSGKVYWIVNRGKGNLAVRGKEAGSLAKNGYVYLMLFKKRYLMHRILYLYMENRSLLFRQVVDHINRDKIDNRWANLRVGTHSQNQFNSVARNKLGIKGVEALGWKFRAKGTLKGKFHHLGTYTTLLEAQTAYQSFARKNHGSFYKEEASIHV